MSSSIPNRDLVVSEPEILSGKPGFTDTRVTIDAVLPPLHLTLRQAQ
jgi:uncharacterized protein (DUF433 family)